MKSAKVTLLSALFCASAYIAAEEVQQATVRVIHNEVVFDVPVDLSDNVQVFVTKCGNYQVEFERTEEESTYSVRVYKKDENSEWQLMAQPTITMAESTRATLRFGHEGGEAEESDNLTIEVILNS